MSTTDKPDEISVITYVKSEPESKPKPNYESKKKDELVALCRIRKIKGFAQKNKDALVKLLLDSDATQQQQPEQEPETKPTEPEPTEPEPTMTPTQQPVLVSPDCAYNAISLFSGAGGDTCGLERAGFKVVAFNEFKEPAKQTHLAVFPSSKFLANPDTGASDIKKVPNSVFAEYRGKVNLIFAGFPCFVSGTLTLTDKGYIPIETVTIDHTLLTHSGQFKPIVNLQKKLFSGSLYDIRIKYRPMTLHATDEHPFYVRERVRTWNNTLRKYEHSFGEAHWTPSHKLTMNHYFGMVVNKQSILPTFTVEKRVNASSSTHITITLDNPDQWFLMGYFIGDGWIEETKKSTTGHIAHKIRFAIHNDDESTVLTRLQKVLPLTDKQCSTGKAMKVGCADIVWFTILKEFGKYSHGKKIPEWVQNAPVNLIQEFLNGYFAADGSARARNTEFRIATVSADLAFGVQRLYLKLGHIVSVQKTQRPPTCVIEGEGRTVNQMNTYCISGRLVHERTQSSFIDVDAGYAWFAPESIHQTTVDAIPVFNFEVADDNSYIVENTIVHNCQGFSHAGKKRENDARNELVWEFERATKLIQPEWIIGENVKGLLARKGRDPSQPPTAPLRPVIDIIRDMFERIGYKITYKVLNASEIGVPQNRKRLIIVGHRGSVYPHVPWDSLTPASTPAQTSIRAFLQPHLMNAIELPSTPYEPAKQSSHFWIHTTETVPTGSPHPNLERLVKGIRNASGKEKAETPTGPAQIIEPGGLVSFGVRKGGYHGMVLDPDVPCNTIISTYNLCPRLFVGLYNPITKTYWVRCMTPSELGQIQGFPADYKWCGTEKEQIIQIGNAVPPPLAERVARSLSRVEFKSGPQVVDTAMVDTAAVDTNDSDDEE